MRQGQEESCTLYLQLQSISFEIRVEEPVLLHSQPHPVLLVLDLPLLILHRLPAIQKEE